MHVWSSTAVGNRDETRDKTCRRVRKDSTLEGRALRLRSQPRRGRQQRDDWEHGTKRTTFLLPDDLADLLERERRRRGTSTAETVRVALRE